MIPISKVRVPFTPDKEAKVLSYVQLVALCAEAIMIEYQDTTIDMRFKNPAINNHSKRIVESANAMKLHISSISQNTNREEFTYNSSLQFHRLIKHFMNLTPQQIENFMDLVDGEMKKQLPYVNI